MHWLFFTLYSHRNLRRIKFHEVKVLETLEDSYRQLAAIIKAWRNLLHHFYGVDFVLMSRQIMRNFSPHDCLKNHSKSNGTKDVKWGCRLYWSIIHFTIDALSRDVVKKHVCIMYSNGKTKPKTKLVHKTPRNFKKSFMVFVRSDCVHGQ